MLVAEKTKPELQWLRYHPEACLRIRCHNYQILIDILLLFCNTRSFIFTDSIRETISFIKQVAFHISLEYNGFSNRIKIQILIKHFVKNKNLRVVHYNSDCSWTQDIHASNSPTLMCSLWSLVLIQLYIEDWNATQR